MSTVKIEERRDTTRPRKAQPLPPQIRRGRIEAVPQQASKVAAFADEFPVVERRSAAGQSDAVAALSVLRDVLVGPVQKFNDARLEELVQIFEEREAALHAALEAFGERQDDHQKAAKRELLEQSKVMRAEFTAMANGLAQDFKEFDTEVRHSVNRLNDEIGQLRTETYSLFETHNEVFTRKLAAIQTHSKNQLHDMQAQTRVDISELKDILLAEMAKSQRATHTQVGRLLVNVGEELGDAGNAQS